MKIPTTLKHKPVIVIENYDLIDGQYAYNSDAKGLSLGLAQWSERGKLEISAKVWRHTGQKWSRQSEELPLHRILDLALLICKSKLYLEGGTSNDKASKDKENSCIERIALQNSTMDISLCLDNAQFNGDIELFKKCFSNDNKIISERLKKLTGLLKKLGY